MMSVLSVDGGVKVLDVSCYKKVQRKRTKKTTRCRGGVAACHCHPTPVATTRRVPYATLLLSLSMTGQVCRGPELRPQGPETCTPIHTHTLTHTNLLAGGDGTTFKTLCFGLTS